jgi:hypothetical protein
MKIYIDNNNDVLFIFDKVEHEIESLTEDKVLVLRFTKLNYVKEKDIFTIDKEGLFFLANYINKLTNGN